MTTSGIHWPTFRHRLIEVRREHHLTQAEFEEKTGRSRVQLSNLETGIAEPGIIDFLVRFCQACDNADPAYILGITDTPRPLSRAVAGAVDSETGRLIHVMNDLNQDSRARVLNFAYSEQSHEKALEKKNEKIISLLLELISSTGDDEAKKQAVEAVRASGLIPLDSESLVLTDRSSLS